MRIYIAGKISGMPLAESKEKFQQAEDLLNERYKQFNVQVVNPHKIKENLTLPEDGPWEDFMANGIRQLLGCDGIYLLENWGNSKGARIERAIAQHLNLTIAYEQN